MVSFLFWNLNNKNIEDIVAKIALRNNIDVIMLVEVSFGPVSLLEKLNKEGDAIYSYAPGIKEGKIKIFTRYSESYLIPKFDEEGGRYTIRHLKLPLMTDILLAVTHFISKKEYDENDQAEECGILSDYIKIYEKYVGHTRTVLVGDLNMNPFETGVVNAKGLNAVMVRSIAYNGSRVVQSRVYPYFYNPMWGFFGDYTRCPPGTYYYGRAKHRMFFWNIFDQVLIRPSLLDKFKNDDVNILDSDGDISLLNNLGRPKVSDHLPIMFKLDL